MCKHTCLQFQREKCKKDATFQACHRGPSETSGGKHREKASDCQPVQRVHSGRYIVGAYYTYVYTAAVLGTHVYSQCFIDKYVWSQSFPCKHFWLWYIHHM